MKDQYKYNKLNKNKKSILIFLLFSLLLIFFLFFQNILFSFFEKNFYFVKKINIFFTNKESIIEENKELRKEIDFYKGNEEIFNFLKEENKNLKERLLYADLMNKKRRIFDVISYEKNGIYQSFLINDRNSYLKKGDLIFSKYNFLLGKVSFSSNGVVKLKPFYALGNKNSFFIYDAGNLKVKVEARGWGSGVLVVKAPRDLEFENLNKVFLTYPENPSYLVAKLVDIKFKTQDKYKTLYFKIFENSELIFKVESEFYE